MLIEGENELKFVDAIRVSDGDVAFYQVLVERSPNLLEFVPRIQGRIKQCKAIRIRFLPEVKDATCHRKLSCKDCHLKDEKDALSRSILITMTPKCSCLIQIHVRADGEGTLLLTPLLKMNKLVSFENDATARVVGEGDRPGDVISQKRLEMVLLTKGYIDIGIDSDHIGDLGLFVT